MTTTQAATLPGVITGLGETPLWSDTEQALYWLDIERPALLRREMRSGATQQWDAPSRIGGVLLREGGGVVVVLRTGVYTLSGDFRKLQRLAPAPFDSDHLFLHEARADPQGRLWVGVINVDHANHAGGSTLFRLNGSLFELDARVRGLQEPRFRG